MAKRIFITGFWHETNTLAQTNGNCEGFHKTILQEFYQLAFRKKFYETIEQ